MSHAIKIKSLLSDPIKETYTIKWMKVRPSSDAVLHMSRIECKWEKSFVLPHLHSIRLMWSTASELGLRQLLKNQLLQFQKSGFRCSHWDCFDVCFDVCFLQCAVLSVFPFLNKFSSLLWVQQTSMLCIVSGVTRQLKKECIRVYLSLNHIILAFYTHHLWRGKKQAGRQGICYK